MTIILFFLLFNFSAVSSDQWNLPSGQLQKKILLRLRDEMIRLDGEGLMARRDRSEDFITTTDHLALEADNNITPTDFFNSFTRLSATYPNLHARAIFNKELEKVIDVPLFKDQSLWITTVTDGQNPSNVLVYLVKNQELKHQVNPGDELVSINGRSISSWLDENFLFCKYPLRAQCDRVFEQQLLSYSLSWKGGPLVYSIKHNNEIINISVTFQNETPNNQDPLLRKRCDYKYEDRYPEMKLIHRGLFSCLFEKENDSSIALLRISSFQYKRRHIPESETIRSLHDEIESLWPIWQKNSGHYKTLIIDLLDNHGGNSPIPYYKILLNKPFQEQYVRFKKTREMNRPELRQKMFWDTNSLELWFQNIVNSGIWDSLAHGEFTPPTPMFCANDNLPCPEMLFEPRNHFFQGSIKVLVNEGCVSSCDGFTWMMKTQANAKLYGFYQAADSAFSRLRADAVWDSNQPEGFKVVINSIDHEEPEGFIVGEIIAVTLTTDAKGNILSGKPLPLDVLVPYSFGEFYPRKVFTEAMKASIGQ